MAKPVNIPNSFATSTSAIPLSYLDQDFNALANSTNDLATYSNYVADTGVANAYIANFPTNINTSSLTAGLRLQFKATNANTGTSTLNVQVNSVSIGSGTIKLTDGTNLPSSAIVAGAMVDVIYDGTNFQLMSDSSGGGEVVTNLTVTGTLSASGVSTFSAGSVSAPAITTSGDTNTGIFFPAADTIAFTEGGAEAMRIDSSGNVGIGTSSLTQRFQVELSQNASTWNYVTNGSNGSGAGSGVLFGTDQGVAGAVFQNSSGNSSGTGANSLRIRNLLNAPIGFETNGTERMRIDSSGNVTLQNNISVGGATPTTSGKGITFPATQSASSDANTLDDYEEGTFTPTWQNVTVSNGNSIGSYTKIGNLVSVQMVLNWGSTTSMAGNLLSISGLPFVIKNQSSQIYVAGVANFLKQGVGWYTGSVSGNGGNTNLNQVNVSGGSGIVSSTSPATWGTTDYFSVTLSYQTS